MAPSIHKAVCPHDCPDTYSILAMIEAGRADLSSDRPTDLGDCSTPHEDLVALERAEGRQV